MSLKFLKGGFPNGELPTDTCPECGRDCRDFDIDENGEVTCTGCGAVIGGLLITQEKPYDLETKQEQQRIASKYWNRAGPPVSSLTRKHIKTGGKRNCHKCGKALEPSDGSRIFCKPCDKKRRRAYNAARQKINRLAEKLDEEDQMLEERINSGLRRRSAIKLQREKLRAELKNIHLNEYFLTETAIRILTSRSRIDRREYRELETLKSERRRLMRQLLMHVGPAASKKKRAP